MESLPELPSRLGCQPSFDLQVFKQRVMSKEYDLKAAVDRSQLRFQSSICDSLPRLLGSRSFCWRVFLGLIPNSSDKGEWVS